MSPAPSHLVLVLWLSTACSGRPSHRIGGSGEDGSGGGDADGDGEGDDGQPGADADADADGDGDADADADLPGGDADADGDDDPVVLDDARSIEMVSGNGQFNLAMWPAGEPLVVLVTDGAGQPVPGETVTWAVTEGAMNLPFNDPLTDDDGLARQTMVGAGFDQQISFRRARITASLQDGQSVEFRATTTAPGASGFEASVILLDPGGAAISGRAGDVVVAGVRVQVALTTGPDTGSGLSDIAMRLELDPAEDPAGPRAHCAGGLVWTDDDGIASCDVEIEGPAGQASIRAVTGGARVHSLVLTVE